MLFDFRCIYKDGNIIYQKSGTPDEVNFGDIDTKNLKKIDIIGGGHIFGVEMNGQFYINDTIVRFDDLPKGIEYRPIYFRRIRQVYLKDTIEVTTKYGIGIQATVDGKNIQKILLVDEHGNLEIINKK